MYAQQNPSKKARIILQFTNLTYFAKLFENSLKDFTGSNQKYNHF